MKNKVNPIAYFPYVNWLTSFGGGIPKNERKIANVVNAITSSLIIAAI